MKKKAITHLTSITAVFLCFALILGSSAVFAADTRPDESVTRIVINDQSGILEGETLQLSATVNASSTFFDSVEWSSSNPNVISCTKDGKIKGLVAGKSATITCKAKYGKTSDKITVYCVKKLSAEVRSSFKSPIELVYSNPYFFVKDLYLDFSSIKNPIAYLLSLFIQHGFRIGTNSVVASFEKVTVCGKWNNFAYIRYGENNALDGFVKSTRLTNAGNGFLTLSKSDMDVWANGVSYSHRKLTTKYNGDIQWTVEHENDYLKFDRETGQVTGLVPGKTATITATADGETATCTIHLLYKWPQPWTAKTNRSTNIYYAVGNGYSKGSVLSENTEFVVEGDCGTNDGWAYGYISGTETWGFVPISHISTKGTVSQYNNMTTTITENGKEKKIPWVWPMYDSTIKNISSPYGPRNITSSGTIHHRGFDITTGIAGDIAGEYVVATCSGTVKKIYNNTTDCGYCISISTDCTDRITGKKISIIYMHLLESPKYENGKKISLGDYIEAGTIIGKVGKTNGSTDSSMGYHLHFEANSQNAAVGDSGRSDFTYTLNPMYFFVNKSVTFSVTNSYKKYGGYWYDLNGGYQNEEIFKSYFVF